MNRLLFTTLLIINVSFCFSQNNSDTVYAGADQYATFENGLEAFYWFVSDNLNYPEDALKNKIEGKVMIQFIVNKDGEVTDEKVVQGVNEHIDKEALRIMQLSPKWNPAILKGKPCNLRMILPITFKILTEEDKLKNQKMREKYEKKLRKKQERTKN